MDGQLFHQLYRRLLEIASLHRRAREQYSDLVIVAVYLWAVIHDRTQAWACLEENWTLDVPWGALPSPSRLSRRLKTSSVKMLLDKICQVLWGRYRRRLARCIDGKALTVSISSKDKTATFGPASGGRLAKGYKIHVIVDGAGVLLAWAVAPLNHGESTVARKLVRKLAGEEGYLIGDSNYDYNQLYRDAAGYGHQLIAPPKKKGQGLGHQVHSRHRLRGLHLLAQPIAAGLRKIRDCTIERFFGSLGWESGGLSQLPGFVRTFHRVRRWVQGKLILQAIRMEKSLELRQ